MRLHPAFLLLLALPQQRVPSVRFETTTDLVIVDVTVRDRSGKPIENLTKDNFIVQEDGKPQTVSVFEFQRLSLDPLPAPLQPPGAAPAAPGPAPSVPTERPPSGRWYQDRRLMVLFFDFSALPAADLFRAQDAALAFLDRHMSAADLVSVMTFSTSLQTVQDFTGDRQKLSQVIRGFTIGETTDLAAEADTADEDTKADTGAVFSADETEFNVFNTDRKLSALATAASRLRSLPARKALVYFSSGVGKTGVENQSQLRSTINAAVRANVSFYPVDARGLVAAPPGGDASVAAPRGTGIFSGQTQRRQRERFEDQQETLFTLAADTGGKAFLDSNDLALGIVEAQKDVRSYYVLGYYSSNTLQDGRYRRIRVTLNGQAQAKLDYRSGYFAPKDFRRFTSADKERHLEEALLLGDPVTDLPLALEVNYFRLSRDRYFVPLALKIPGTEISLARRGDREETEFDFIGQVRDSQGRLAASVRDAIRVKLDEAGAAQLARRHLQYDTGFLLSPGAYRFKVLARENRTGKMGTFETEFQVPDLASQSASLRLSSVVWSSQREPLAAAVGSAEKKDKLLDSHPLVQDGHKLIPSITRVFRRDQNLHVYFEVYDPALEPAQKTPSVAATVSFFRGRTKVFESTPVQATSIPASRSRAVPVQFQLSLATLRPGQYTCQVNIVDEVGRKAAFPRARLVLLP